MEKDLIFKLHRSNKNMFLFEKSKALQNQLNILNEEYCIKLSSRLANPLTGPKTNWSILKMFLNNKKCPCIPPLFHENKFIIKLNYLTIFFVNQCFLLSNNSVFPADLSQLTNKYPDSTIIDS